MPLIDTHCHYNMEPLFANWRAHWQTAQTHGVEKSIVIGTDLETSQRALEIAQAEQNLYAAVGVHPHDTETLVNFAALESLVSQPQVIAIGETGLDYFRLPTDETRSAIIAAQHAAFRRHIELALTHHKLLIVHVRDQETPEKPTLDNAYWDALRILSEYYPATTSAAPTDKLSEATNLSQQMYVNAQHLIDLYSAGDQSQAPTFILHCVSGPLAYIDQAVALGAYFGIAGNVTYKNAERIREIVKKVPAQQLLLETDAPFLPPQQHRGTTCEPWMIAETAAALN